MEFLTINEFNELSRKEQNNLIEELKMLRKFWRDELTIKKEQNWFLYAGKHDDLLHLSNAEADRVFSELQNYYQMLVDEFYRAKLDFRDRPKECLGIQLTYQNSMGSDLPVHQKILRLDITHSIFKIPIGEVYTLKEIKQYMKDNCANFYLDNNLIFMRRRLNDEIVDIIENVSLEEIQDIIHDVRNPETHLLPEPICCTFDSHYKDYKSHYNIQCALI